MLCIGIDARELVGQPAGKGQYAQRIIEEWLKQTQEELKLILYVQEDSLVNVHSSKLVTVVICQQSGRSLQWHRRVAHRLKKDGVDVFFAPFSYQSAIWNTVPTVTTVHDLAVFLLPNVTHNKRAQLVEKVLLKRCVQRSAALLTVSKSTAQDLIQVVHADSQKITITLLAPMVQSVTRLPRNQRDGYFLFVGTLEPRKNIHTLLQAYALLGKEQQQVHPLYLVGKQGWGGEDYQALAQKLSLADTVKFLGYRVNAELDTFYQKAFAMIYPSWYEGFGLPVAEAMAWGTPVITSSVSSLPEVVGDTGIFCDPADPQSLADAMMQYSENITLWEEKSRATYDRIQTFRWQDTAQSTLEVLRVAALG